MEKMLNNISIGLLFWQLLLLVLSITLVYYIMKRHKKWIKYLERNS